MAMVTDKERIDEALELLWTLDEEDKHGLAHFRTNADDSDVDAVIETLLAEGHAQLAGNEIGLTDKGRQKARGLVRRQRLAERLFTDVFEMPDETVMTDACKVEHILSEELTESVCTFLGHPPTCPHGKPIPRGECCRKFKVEVRPLVMRLSEFEVGAKGRITFIVASDHSRINKLNSLGIAAGSVIKLIQKTPSFVLAIDETTVAIDPDIAKEIFVRNAIV
jgi:DtxR family transcriptional regulator, Mn-dependent transcriptional regulator